MALPVAMIRKQKESRIVEKLFNDHNKKIISLQVFFLFLCNDVFCRSQWSWTKIGSKTIERDMGMIIPFENSRNEWREKESESERAREREREREREKFLIEHRVCNRWNKNSAARHHTWIRVLWFRKILPPSLLPFFLFTFIPHRTKFPASSKQRSDMCQMQISRRAIESAGCDEDNNEFRRHERISLC